MALPPLVPDVEIYAGDTVIFATYGIAMANVPVNYYTAGWRNLQAQWRTKTDDTDSIPLIAQSLTPTDFSFITISASAAATRQMRTNGVWDLQMVHEDGSVRTLLRGKTKYKEDVTRP